MITEQQTKTSYTCQFCQRSFGRESTLSVHMCEPKRRHNQRTDTGVQIGFRAYLRFYETTQGSARLKTYEDFSASSFYRAFVKFGQYCQRIRAVNVPRFVDWLLKNNKKIDHWCRDSIYDQYLIEHIKHEHVNDALSRAIEHSIAWEEETQYSSHNYLRHANPNAVCYAITSGRVTGWVLYNSDSGVDFLSKLNEEQIAMTWHYIDTDFWTKKFHDYPADTEYAKQMLQQAGW